MHTVCTSMGLCIHIHPHMYAYLYIHKRMYAPGRGMGPGSEKVATHSPPKWSLSVRASLPNSSSFPHFQIHPSLLIFHLLFYTHTLISKISERSLVLSTLLIRLHSLTEPPIMQFIRSLHYPNKTLPNASDTVGRCKTPGPHRGMTGNIVWSLT